MIRFHDFRREHICAIDGSIGAIYDLYFDDVLWQIRYFVVDTRRWLPGRKVLIAPEAARQDQSWDDGIPVNLTRDQVKRSPGFETELPVSRQNEAALIAYYLWAQRFTQSVAPALSAALPSEPVNVLTVADPAEPRLRSAKEVIGYRVVGPEGTVGEIDDLRFDVSSFLIRSIEVDPKIQVGLPVIPIPPEHVESVRWNDRTVEVDMAFGSPAGMPRASHALPSTP